MSGRWALAVLLALAACKGDAPAKQAPPGPEPAPEEPEPTRALDIAACELFSRAVEGFLACPAVEPYHAEFVGLRDSVRGEALGGHHEAAAFDDQCLHALVRIDTRADVAGCNLELSAEEKQLIATRRMRRTPPPNPSDPGLAAFFRKLAADRDRACACADSECAASAGTLKQKDLHPARRSAQVRAAHDAILAELGDCKMFEEFRDTPK